jgi:hypothetical protein
MTTGATNVAMGYLALGSNTTASSNVAIGVYALDAATTGGSNTAIGTNTLSDLTTATQNVALGDSAGADITTGVRNTCIGVNSGEYGGNVLTTGAGNTLIGYGAIPSAVGDTSSIVVAGQSASAATTGKGSNTGFISPNGGAVYQGNNSTTWSQTSDIRIKKNIVDNNVGLEKIKNIQVRNFEYKLPEEISDGLTESDAIDKQGIQLGVIAQEIETILPDMVTTESTGVMTVDADNMTWYLVNAVKELSAKVEELESKLNGE